MYFLVLGVGDHPERAEAFVASHQGEMARPSLVAFSTKSIINFDVRPDELQEVGLTTSIGGRIYLPVLHLAFGVSRNKDYGEIEATLKLMFGSRFLGRSRKRREQ